jgi:hypothetical protein
MSKLGDKFSSQKYWTFHVQAWNGIQWCASIYGSDDEAEAKAIRGQVLTEDRIWCNQTSVRKARVARRIGHNHYIEIENSEERYDPKTASPDEG